MHFHIHNIDGTISADTLMDNFNAYFIQWLNLISILISIIAFSKYQPVLVPYLATGSWVVVIKIQWIFPNTML